MIAIMGFIVSPLWNLNYHHGFYCIPIVESILLSRVLLCPHCGPSQILLYSHCGIYITITGFIVFPLWNLYYHHGFYCVAIVESILPSRVLLCSHCGIYITITGFIVFPLWNLYYHHGFYCIPIVESILP